MTCDKTFLSLRLVFRSDVNRAYFLEKVQLQQIFCRPGTQKKKRFRTFLFQLIALPKQRGDTHSATNKQCLFMGRPGETIAKRQETIYCVTFVQLAKMTRSVSYTSDKQPQLITFIVHVIDRDWTTEKCAWRVIDANFHKLTRNHVRESVVMGQLQQDMMIRKMRR